LYFSSCITIFMITEYMQLFWCLFSNLKLGGCCYEKYSWENKCKPDL
jgi:hypothetical protein